MKSLCAIFLSFFCVSISFASPQLEGIKEEPCRSYFEQLDPELSPVEQVRQDFIQGTWRSDLVHIQDWSFQEDGNLFLINKVGGEYVAEQATWDVQYQRAGTILQIRHLSGQKVLRYFVEQTCQGIDLENIDTEEILRLDYVKGQDQKYQSTNQSIKGHWVHVMQAKNIAAFASLNTQSEGTPVCAKISIDFNEDGTFQETLSCQARGVQEVVNGQWALSPNSQFLIVFAQDGSKKVRCFPIKYLEWDELVLGQILPSHFYASDDTGLYFNKS